MKDADVNRQLFNIANLCQKLRAVLSSPGGDADADPGRCNHSYRNNYVLGL